MDMNMDVNMGMCMDMHMGIDKNMDMDMVMGINMDMEMVMDMDMDMGMDMDLDMDMDMGMDMGIEKDMDTHESKLLTPDMGLLMSARYQNKRGGLLYGRGMLHFRYPRYNFPCQCLPMYVHKWLIYLFNSYLFVK
jgi:hypothetical protein